MSVNREELKLSRASRELLEQVEAGAPRDDSADTLDGYLVDEHHAVRPTATAPASAMGEAGRWLRWALERLPVWLLVLGATWLR